MLISQLVSVNENLTLVNDVQLAWYPDKPGQPRKPTNAELAGAYMWTSEHVGNSLSSLDWLELLRLSYLAEKPTNRFVMVATYGRGKSHLALALANYFGQPTASPVVQGLLANIQSAAPERGASFRDFKNRRGAFLVVRISGDEPGSLNQQFIHGLEVALSEHPEIQNPTLPFWYDKARQVLEALSDDEAGRANDALAAHQLDVGLLLEQVKVGVAVWNNLNVHDLCVEAVRAAKGVEPNFGGEVSLQEVVEWACDTFCSVDPDDGKPCGGLLILFDEFVRFINKYVRNTRGDSLQALLDGVRNKPGLAAMLALAQEDPDQAADNARAEGGTEGQVLDLKKQLGRMPADDRHLLHTSLENVLSKYLQQDRDAWATQMQKGEWSSALFDANDDVMALFSARYDGGVRWSAENVQSIITQGCFPLHPLTTALLADVNFQGNAAGARSIMGFLRLVLVERRRQPVEKKGRPNWVYATEIVRVFGEMVNGTRGEYGQFQNALGRVGNEASEVQVGVLQAILLHDVAGLRPRSVGGYVPLVSMLSGFPEDECRAALDEMTNAGYLRYDETGKRWIFPPVGEDDRPIERELERRVQGHSLDAPTLSKLREEWVTTLLPMRKADSFNLDWGNADDWAAAPLIFTRETFTASNLKKSIEKPQSDLFAGLKLPPRGYVVHLLATHEGDVEWARQNTAQVLDDALRGQATPPPIVVCVPSEALPHLPKLILRRRALTAFSASERRDYGASTVKSVEERYDKQLKDAMDKLLAGARTFEVPQPYRAHVANAFAGALDNASLSLALRECYGQAYGNRPSALLPQYSLSRSNSYRNGIKAIADKLKTDTVGSLEAGIASGPGKDLVFSGPRPLVREWGLLAGQGYGVQPPQGRAKLGWDVLDKAFAQGKGAALLGKVIEKLLAAPYGYDPAGLTLLLCAWYGRNSRLLSISANNAPHSMDPYWVQLGKPWDFLCALAKRNVAWARQDVGRDEREANEIIERVQLNESIGRDEASAFAERLQAFADDERQTNTSLREQARDVAKRLAGDVEGADKYDTEAARIESKIESARRVAEVSKLLSDIGQLPPTGLVLPAQMEASKLAAKAQAKMQSLVETDCTRLEQLRSLTDYKHQDEQLREIESDLKRAHHDDLVVRVQSARVGLGGRRSDLEARSHDEPVLVEVNAMANLSTLKGWRKALERLDGLSPRAEETRTIIQAARGGLEERIREREQWIDTVEGQVEAITSSASAREARDEIQLRRGLLEGTPEDARAQAALARADRLQSTWEALSRMQNRIESALREGPSALDGFVSKLAELEKGGDESFNSPAHNFLGLLRREMDGGRERAQQQASRRLEELWSAFNANEDIHKLNRALSSCSPWLPQSARGDWQALRHLVEEKVDEDTIGHIVARFRDISDPAHRAACLRALEEAQHELEGTSSDGSSNGHTSPPVEASTSSSILPGEAA